MKFHKMQQSKFGLPVTATVCTRQIHSTFSMKSLIHNNILYEKSNTKTIILTINMEMPKVLEWLKSNKLHIDIVKIVVMLFHTRQKSINIDDNSLVIDGNTIHFTLIQGFWVLILMMILHGKVDSSDGLICSYALSKVRSHG